MTVLLALLSAILGGASDFAGGTISRRLPPQLVVGASQLAGGLFIAGVAVMSGALHDPSGYVGWGVGAGATLGIGLVSFYAALAAGTMSVVAPIAALGVGVPFAWGLVSGEAPSSIQLLGVLLGVAGIALVCGPEISAAAVSRSLLLAAVAGVSLGASMAMTAQGAQISVIMTVGVSKLTVLVPLCCLALLKGTVGKVMAPDVLVFLLIAASDVGATLSFAFASTRGLISLVAVIASLYPVVTVLLARVFQHERMSSSQTVGIVSSMVGVACIAFSP